MVENKNEISQKVRNSEKDNSTFSITFFVGMAVFMTVIVMAGFWPTYFGYYLFGQELKESGLVEVSGKTHIHTFVFMSWMGLLLSQTFFAAQGNIKKHVQFGRYGVGIGVLVVAFGLAMAFFRAEAVVYREIATWSEIFPFKFFLDDPFVLISEFAILFGLGFHYRTKPVIHKRFMLFATIAMMSAAASRLHYIFGPWSLELVITFAVAPIWVYDLYKEKKLHSATLIGTGVVCIYIFREYLI